MGAALGTPPVVAAIVEHVLGPEVTGEGPLFSERIYEKMNNGSRARPALERGVPQAEVSRRGGMVMEAAMVIVVRPWAELLDEQRLGVGEARPEGLAQLPVTHLRAVSRRQ